MEVSLIFLCVASLVSLCVSTLVCPGFVITPNCQKFKFAVITISELHTITVIIAELWLLTSLKFGFQIVIIAKLQPLNHYHS